MICGEPHAQVVPPRLVKSTIAREAAGEQHRAEVVHRVARVTSCDWKVTAITVSAIAPTGRLT